MGFPVSTTVPSFGAHQPGAVASTFGTGNASIGAAGPVAPTPPAGVASVFGVTPKPDVATSKAPTIGLPTSTASVTWPGSTAKGTTGPTALPTTTPAPQPLLQAGFGMTSAPTAPAQSGGLLDGPTGQMTFEDLEKRCAEWRKELDRQEESFLKKATQINAWDRLINANSDKITQLNEYMKKVI